MTIFRSAGLRIGLRISAVSLTSFPLCSKLTPENRLLLWGQLQT